MIEEKGTNCGGRCSNERCRGYRSINTFYEEYTSQDKSWIFDSGSTVLVCSHKQMFNSLVAKEEGIIKIVNGLACEVIGTETVKVTERDGMVCAQKAVRFVPEARYSLIYIGVLDEEGCRI